MGLIVQKIFPRGGENGAKERKWDWIKKKLGEEEGTGPKMWAGEGGIFIFLSSGHSADQDHREAEAGNRHSGSQILNI